MDNGCQKTKRRIEKLTTPCLRDKKVSMKAWFQFSDIFYDKARKNKNGIAKFHFFEYFRKSLKYSSFLDGTLKNTKIRNFATI